MRAAAKEPVARAVRSKEDVIALAQSLAKPVVRNMLPLDHAIASIGAAVGRGCRLGLLEIDDPEGLIDVAIHILGLNIGIGEDQRDAIISDIGRVLRPLIVKREPVGRLMAEAFDVNAAAGTVLTDIEVEGEVANLLYQARAKAIAATGPAAQPATRRPRRYRG